MGAVELFLQNEGGASETSSASPEEILSDYLDHLYAPLVGIMPFQERDRLRQEAQFHIEGRIRMYELDGMSPREATLTAVRKYGDTEALSERFLEEYMDHLPKGPLARKLGLPNAYAAFYFGQAGLGALLLVVYWVMNPNPEPYTFGLSVPELRRIFPEPLPLPDRNPIWLLMWAYAIFAPIVAGWLTGRHALIGAAKAAWQVLILLALVTYVLGTLVQPMDEGLWMGLVQVFWWVPIGTLSAHVAGVLTRRRRLRFRPDRRKS